MSAVLWLLSDVLWTWFNSRLTTDQYERQNLSPQRTEGENGSLGLLAKCITHQTTAVGQLTFFATGHVSNCLVYKRPACAGQIDWSLIDPYDLPRPDRWKGSGHLPGK
jgi:hypothetical protein